MIMREKMVHGQEKNSTPQIVNQNIRICIICGYDKVESHEFGMSCEECGASFGRSKC